MTHPTDLPFMLEALELAQHAATLGEVPVGAVVVHDGQVIARDHNRREANQDFSAHAEFLAMRSAAKVLGTWRLTGCTVYVTLEPCPMCAQAIAFARLRRLYFGAYDPKAGGVDHGPRIFERPGCNHRPEIVGGLDEQRCAAVLKGFFAARR